MAGVWIRREPVPEPEATEEVSPRIQMEENSLPKESSHGKNHRTEGREELQQTFDLGLFILQETFTAQVGLSFLLRVFEPRYLLLIERCIKNKELFGVVAGENWKEGYVCSIKRHRYTTAGHIIVEAIPVSTFKPADDTCKPFEPKGMKGLKVLKVKIRNIGH